MSDIRSLYRDIILDHGKNPRNFALPEDATCRADGDNPLCGDRVEVGLALAGEEIADIGFRGHGCAISLAAASMMTEAVKGLAAADALALSRQFHHLVEGGGGATPGLELSSLTAFATVADYPMRRRCATLCWETLEAALGSRAQ